MLKKLLVCFAFLLMTATYLSTNKPFLYEKANVVYSGKSLGQMQEKLVLPLNKFDGVFKSYSVDTDYCELVKKYNAKLIFIEKTDGVISKYYYSNSIPYKEIIKGKKVNLHIAISNSQITIGTPIIYGGY